MAGQPGFFDADERLKALSAAGDPLERLAAVVDFELFRPELEAALARSDRAKGGRPPYDAVLMFRVLVLQTLHTLSDDATEYQLKDRLSFMRFCGLALHDPVPDALAQRTLCVKTIWFFREQLTRAGAHQRLFDRFDAILRERGYLAIGGQIVDATVIEARRPRLNRTEKETIKGGGVPADWTKARARQIDRDGRWTLKRGRKRQAPPDASGPKRQATAELLLPVFGYKNHVGIDRAHGFIRRSTITHAAPTTGASSKPCSIATTWQAGCGPTPPTAPPPTSRCSTAAGWRRGSSGRSRAASRCRRTFAGAMRRGPGYGPRSSTCSPPKSAASA